jgi:hypothetical protein
MVFRSPKRQGNGPAANILAADRFLGAQTKRKSIAVALVARTILLITGVQAASAATIELGQKPELPAALSNADLSQMAGGASPTGVAVTTQTLSATNSGNSITANSVVTGDVTLQTGTFNGFNGIGNFVFNTGNNNNVQGSLSVTIITPQVN